VQRHVQAQIGANHSILMESPYMGRTEAFTEVHFDSPQEVGKIIAATITGRNGDQLTVT